MPFGDTYRLRLADAVASCLGLQVVLWVPVAIEDNTSVGCGKIDSCCRYKFIHSIEKAKQSNYVSLGLIHHIQFEKEISHDDHERNTYLHLQPASTRA